MLVDCIRNGTHGATEEPSEQPALPGPQDASDEAAEGTKEVEDDV
jgi:hypothetical protein